MKKDFSEFKGYINGKKVGVVGIGVSNKPLIQFLVELGAKVTAFDKKSEKELGDVIIELRNQGVEFELGENYLDKLEGFDVVFKTPGMRIDNPALVKAKESGTYITSEMEEFVRYCPAKVYAVTGSDGKTTTTTIIHKLLSNEGYTTWVGGNIGTPLFSRIEEIKQDHKVVLELSSFQLMTMDTSPEVAIVTNLSPNHLDMHKGMEEYVDAKKNIFKYQNNDGILILNRENDITYSFKDEAKGVVKFFSSKREIENGAYFKNECLYVNGEEICKREDIAIKGMHNVENYLAAFLATKEEVSTKIMNELVKTFTGVEHRNQLIREDRGVKYYNDSIASSPTRTIASIGSFEKPVILIAGGYDKKIPFAPLAEEGYKYIKEIIIMGATREKIKKAFEEFSVTSGINVPMHIVNSLEDAVKKANEIANKGDYVVLSPACASFDAFPNFEIRGNKFIELVNNL